MGGKNLAVVVVLLVLILGAVVVIAKRAGYIGSKAQVPAAVLDVKITKVETKAPYKTVERTFGEWEKLGHNEAGLYKDPDTNEYTMVAAVQCVSCKQLIPPLQESEMIPASVLAMPNGKEKTRAKEKARLDAWNNYLCPKCQRPAYLHRDRD